MKYFDRVAVVTATTGTGTVTLGSVLDTNFFTFSEQGAVDTDQVYYMINEGGDVEIGIGTLGGTVSTLSRDTVLSSRKAGTAGTSKMNLAGSAQVRCISPSDAILALDLTHPQTFTTAQQIQARANIDGQQDLGWVPVEIVEVTTPVSAIVVAMPTGAKSLRMSGLLHRPASATAASFRLSFDGGSTYASAADSYFYSYILLSGSTLIDGTVTTSDLGYLALEQNTSTDVPSRFALQIDAYAGMLPRWASQSSGLTVPGSVSQMLTAEGGCRTSGVPTHVQILGGDFAAGTRFLVEAF